jgi:hypothetical protein
MAGRGPELVMAILCPAHSLLFIQAPRTGCTAIERLLLERFGGESVPPSDILGPDGFIRIQRKHCSIRQLVTTGLIPDDYESRYTTVTTVRNPFDSLVSMYVKKRETYQRRLNEPDAWMYKVRGYIEDMEFCRTHSFEEWVVKRYAVRPIERLLGRGHRALYGRYTDGVQIVMRFERLQQDFEAMMRGVGVIGDVTIPNVNATRQRERAYQSYYTPRARRIVEYVFQGELALYGYSFDGPGTTAIDGRAVEA